MLTTGVYTLSFANGKLYVGSSQDLRKRCREHMAAMKRGNRVSPALLAAYRKHGEPIFSTIIVCRPEDRIFFEQIAIDALRPAYNLSRVAGAVDWTPELRAKVSKAHSDRFLDPKVRAKRKEQLQKLAADPQWRMKMKEIVNAHFQNPDNRRRRAEANQRRAETVEWRAARSEGVRKFLAEPQNIADLAKRNQTRGDAYLAASPMGPFIKTVEMIIHKAANGRIATDQLNAANIPNSAGGQWTPARVVNAKRWLGRHAANLAGELAR